MNPHNNQRPSQYSISSHDPRFVTQVHHSPHKLYIPINQLHQPTHNYSPPHQHIPRKSISKPQELIQFQKKQRVLQMNAGNIVKSTQNQIPELQFVTPQPNRQGISHCSTKETIDVMVSEDTNVSLNQKIEGILLKLKHYDGKFIQIQQKLAQPQQKVLENNKITRDMQNLITKAVQKQLLETQNYYVMHQKLLKADLDTLKLEVLSYSTKRQTLSFADKLDKKIDMKIERIELLTKQSLDQFMNNFKHQEFQNKKDIEQLRSKIQETLSKLHNHHLNNEEMPRISIVKELTMQVLHRMRIYHEEDQVWVELGTGHSLYFVDSEGCLMDTDGRYILDSQNQLVKLNPEQIEILKNARVMN